MSDTVSTSIRGTIDPFTIEICRNRLDSIVQEMATALIKTSSSPTTTETKDFSCSLFDYQGRQLSFAGYILYHASSNWEGIEAIRREYPPSEIEDGDVFIANDPCFGGGIHPGDVCVFQPHFHDGQIVAWSACASHQIDVGGAVPGGWNSTATECYAEAILMPPVKIVRRGTIDRSMWMLLMNNIRMPDRVGLDFKGLIASNSVAGRRLRELAALYGNERFSAMQDRILDLSEASMRRRITELAAGTYRAVDWIENNGHEDGLWRVACELRVTPEGMVFDFNDSDPQTQGFVNCGPSGMGGGALVHIIQMFGYDIPYNDGFLRPFQFVADRGKLVNATKPAPVSAGHMNATFKIQEVAQACINKMLAASPPPWNGRAMGMWADNWTLHLCYGLNREGSFEIYINMDGGGCGGAALPMRDGIPVAGCPQQCGMDLPDVEFNEMNFPLLFHFKKLRKNSGGAGRYRGGLGLEYAWSIYGVPEMNVVLFNQRYKVPQYGMFGADIVSSSMFAHYRETDLRERLAGGIALPVSRSEITGEGEVTSVNDLTRVLTDNDIFYVANCGGGGYGDPLLRDPALVVRDVRDGYVDADVAQNVYGVVLKPGGEADAGATQRLRDEIRRARLAAANAGRRGPHELGTRDAVVGEHSPAIRLGRYGTGLFFQCTQCNTLLSSAQSNWKTEVSIIESPIDTKYLAHHRLEIGLRSDPAMIARHYLCPGCGTALEVEMAVEGDSIDQDSRPDHYRNDAAPLRTAS
jgi:N-methylhydantoinase B